jgi:hypothetical protein
MRDELEEHDVTIDCAIKSTTRDLILDPTQWTIATEDGRVLAPKSTDPDTLRAGKWSQLTYPTAGTLIEAVTFTPRFKFEDETEVVFPVVTLRHSKGTLMTFSP